MPAYRSLVKTELLRIMTDLLSFRQESGDTCGGIPRENIFFRKVINKVTPIDSRYTMEKLFPGIVISTPYAEPFDMSLGEVAHDEYHYHWLAQIVDSDNREPTANVNSYWKWQEQILRMFQFLCLQNIGAYRAISNAVNVDVVDTNKWLADENFVCGVHIVVKVWMTRGVT